MPLYESQAPVAMAHCILVIVADDMNRLAPCKCNLACIAAVVEELYIGIRNNRRQKGV